MEVKLINGWSCESCGYGNINFSMVCKSCCRRKQSQGLGDTIYKLTTALHIPHCGGCEKRRQQLNALVPYKP